MMALLQRFPLAFNSNSSYFWVFSNGVYPSTYPPHPTLPTPIPHVTETSAGSVVELAEISRVIDLKNNRRAPIVVDFAYITDLVREIIWNV